MKVMWWVLACLLAAAFAALGVWQWQRAEDKRHMLQQAAQVVQQRQAVPLAQAADPVLASRIEWAEGVGAFLPRPLLLLDNQQHQGRVGVRAYRVFKPVQGMPMLVDLGWLPVALDRKHWPELPPPALEQVRGLLVAPPSPGLVAPVARQEGEAVVVTAIATPGLAQQLHVESLAPRVLRLDPALPGGAVRDLDVLPNTMPPERHIAYAVQWWALSLAVLMATYFASRRRRPPEVFRA